MSAYTNTAVIPANAGIYAPPSPRARSTDVASLPAFAGMTSAFILRQASRMADRFQIGEDR